MAVRTAGLQGILELGTGRLRQRKPLDRGMQLRGGLRFWPSHSLHIAWWTGLSCDSRRIHQPVPAHEDLVAAAREVRHYVAAPIVRHHDANEPCAKFSGFSDDPHTGLRTFRTRDGAA